MLSGSLSKYKTTGYALFAFIGAIIISLIIYSPQIPLNVSLDIDSPSPVTIASPQFIEFQTESDRQKTKQLIETRKRLIEPVYSIDETINKLIKEDIILFFNTIREFQLNPALNESTFLSKNELTYLTSFESTNLIQLESDVMSYIDELLKDGIKQINYQIIDINLNELVDTYYGPLDRQIISKLIKQYLRTNLSIDTEKTQAITQQQINSISPFVTVYKTGQVIISKGEIVNSFHLQTLQSLNLYGTKANILNFIGILIVTCFLFILFERFLYFFYIKLHQKISTYMLCYTLLLLVIIVSRLLFSIQNLAFVDNLQFLLPLPVLVMLICLLLTPNIGMLAGSVSAILIAMLFQNNLHLFLYLFFASCATTFACYQVVKRSDLVKAGNIIGIINALLIFTIGISNDVSSVLWFLYNGIIGFSNGLLCAMISFAFLPYFEALFKITTSLGLLENANLNHPLLKKLMLNAPGTYQHSLMVANLSEAAAESIGADVILTRIGAYFHDIGKMKRPIFFSENQFSNGNPHDNLSPRMSKMIISAHPKDGQEMAEKHKLPKIIQDIMMEHHGTSLVSFFYSIAKQEESFDDSDSSKEEFRYPGPKPQTRESGIVMLADSVEASIRSLDKPSLPKIENLIDKIFVDKIVDYQLDESGLTFNDVSLIKSTFISIFKSIYHNRLDYQEEIEKIISQTKSKYNEE